MAKTVTWAGYDFDVCEPTGTWNDVPGVYIFAGVKSGYWEAIYIGQTASFKDRMPNHERWPAAKREGATHIHARVVQRLRERERIEQELISKFDPSLNVQYR